MVVTGSKIRIKKYWDLEFSPETHYAYSPGSRDPVLDFWKSLSEVHMISDVPVGVLLSGGVDSTAILSHGHVESRSNL